MMRPTDARQPALLPFECTVEVSWDQVTAFRRFTHEFASWWPSATHSIGGPELKQVVFEPREGGLIYEEHHGGRRFQWGRIFEWNPPECVRFHWHPSRDFSTSQEVTVAFEQCAAGTRVRLTADRWDRWGKGARAARRGYRMGWGYVLNVFAGRRTLKMFFIDRLAGVMGIIMKLRGGHTASIRRAGGEIH